jgi:hypothetical protein
VTARHYVTACRRWQLPVLLESMRRHCGEFRLHALAWDFDPHDDPYLGPDVEVTPRGAFFRANPRWANMPGPPRATIDQVATARWRFAYDVMTETGEPVTLIDGDIQMLASPEPVFEEIGNARLAVTPHRIPARADGLPGVTRETHGVYGEFNAGWTFIADSEIAGEMSERTLAWSYTEVRLHPGDGRPDFGDQGALERVARAAHAHVVSWPVNIGPWGIHSARLERVNGRLLFGGRELVSYHFSSLRICGGVVEQSANADYQITDDQQRLLYDSYIESVKRHAQ